MNAFSQVIGYGWALIGFGNIISSPTEHMTLSLFVNTIFFILPGVLVGNSGRRHTLDKQ